jgi:hypothetical protein
MNSYQLNFTDGSKGYCEGGSPYDAKIIAEKLTGKKVAGGEYQNFEVKSLPYPTSGMIWQHDHPVHRKTPPFCYSPNECCGKTSCPKNYSCTE